ncbi:MAG: L-seryl-tRNA(Sec) selenium transferase [Chloroflexota bacterium]|nr:L-seryl-tRNA(Sec) selenium transferase [Chloroflexota bacterium]
MELQNIPSMTKLLDSSEFSDFDINQEILKKIINNTLDSVRKTVYSDKNNNLTDKDIKSQIVFEIKKIFDQKPNIVINGTGVILHTNIGRAPISKESSEQIQSLLSNYSDLELDIKSKNRKSRISKSDKLLSLIIGSESSAIFNNNAMALVIALASLGKNKEVLVSRSESVEIGGGFRIPEIIKMSGQKLIDIGTTNKTYLSDYEENISEKTVAILKVHKSNYRIEGFTEEVDIKKLSNLATKHNISLIHDLGSGNFMDTTKYGLPFEPSIMDSINDGSHMTLFSGDKLLGGPQCGIIVGNKESIEKINKNPLARAARIDKLNLYILNNSLTSYVSKSKTEKIPSWSLIKLDSEEIKKRANLILEKLPKEFFRLTQCKSTIGGGTFPETYIDSYGIKMTEKSLTKKLESYLLNMKLPILGKIENDNLVIDLRTIFNEYDNYLIESLNNFFNK